jgi:hypothetical protein
MFFLRSAAATTTPSRRYCFFRTTCKIILVTILVYNKISVMSFLTTRTARSTKAVVTNELQKNSMSWATLLQFESSSISSDDTTESIQQFLMERFQGDFDNYQQVVEDRALNLFPREGGGHEHFHCTLVPITNASRLAAFFFDGNPERIFRFRYYKINVVNDDTNNRVLAVEMKLHTLHPELELLLKSQSEDPISWPSLFQRFQPKDSSVDKVTLLPKCEVSWSVEKDPIQHAYTKDVPEEDQSDAPEESVNSLHAVMVHGEAVVNSTIVPGMAIRILDQLSLYPDVFYINDRGFDPLTGEFIYGNQRGVPYRLERVAHFHPIVSSSNSKGQVDQVLELERKVTNQDLAWTLGPKWRTRTEYENKLDCIGGPSAGINKSRYKSKITITGQE